MNPVESLAALAGRWHGTSTLHDPTTGRPEESPSTVDVSPVLDGRFVRLDYTWAHRGAPQEGSLLVGFDPKSGEASGHWVDTWHMGRRVMACRGGPAGGVLALLGSFPAPPGPDWGWRIDLSPEVDALRVAHTCISPGGDETPAAECTYLRS